MEGSPVSQCMAALYAPLRARPRDFRPATKGPFAPSDRSGTSDTQGPVSDNGEEEIAMMWFGWGSGAGWMGWLAMTLSMVAFWGGLIWLVVWGTRRLGPGPSRSPDATAILEERFARGEIDKEEFDRRKSSLQAG